MVKAETNKKTGINNYIMKAYHIAEINIARMKGVNINDPIMKEFVDNIDTVNAIAESSKGFVWRLKDDSDNATNMKIFDDEQVIVNISVWESIEDLENFMYKSFHSDFLRRRKDWFHRFGKVYTAMWWTGAGQFPTIEEAVENLDYLEKFGVSEKVFDFRVTFPKPE